VRGMQANQFEVYDMLQ